MNWNVAFYGDWIDLGKKGTRTDIQLYNHASSAGVFSFATPVTYPDKIGSLLLPASMANLAVVHLTEGFLDYRLGEGLVLLDSLGLSGVFVADDVVRELAEPFVRGSSFASWDVVSESPVDVMEKIKSFVVEPREGACRVLVDHSFEVRSVGTVVLGIVQRGGLKQYDKLVAYPSMKEVVVKSIQKQDKDFKVAGFNERVGLALKGVRPGDVPRGTVLSAEGVRVADSFPAVFRKSSFFTGVVPRDLQLCLGLQLSGMHYADGVARCVKPIALVEKRGVVSVAAKPGGLRVVGALDVG
jgi:selenocysteine-specific translation elongation factor